MGVRKRRFDIVYHPLYNRVMRRASLPPTNSILLRGDGTFSSSGAKTIVKSFKISEKHNERLDELPYKNNGGVLVRLLLEMYFDDKLPAVKMKFNSLLQRK